MAPLDTVRVVDTVRVTEPSVDPATAARLARLEIQILERDARIRDLQESLDATRREVVRNLAKLQSQASRAEAASGLAEAELAIQALARMDGGDRISEYGQARARLREGSVELAAENYGGALYLSNEARALALAAQARVRAADDVARAPGETPFATEVPLVTGADRANVRAGPGLDFRVLFTLDPRSPVAGRSYVGEWVRIVGEDGREGWIFHTLVQAPG